MPSVTPEDNNRVLKSQKSRLSASLPQTETQNSRFERYVLTPKTKHQLEPDLFRFKSTALRIAVIYEQA